MHSAGRTLAVSLVLALLGGAAALAEPEPDADGFVPGALVGKVTSASAPLASAWVYAYQIADFSLEKVATLDDGSFRFGDLPAGLYKIIVFKAGFVPRIVMLSRTTAQSRQSLELELTPEGPGEPAESGFWAIRERIPTDVLRDIQIAGLREEMLASGPRALPPAQLQARMQAMTGVQEGIDYGEAQVNGGRVGLDGRLGAMKIGLTGRYAELDERAVAGRQAAEGSTQWFTFRLENDRRSRLDISTLNNRLETAALPVDFESHSVRWSQRVGRSSSTDFTAQYTAESNFHRQGVIDSPVEIPDASRALRFEGSYTTPINERATLQAGIRYRDMESEYDGGPRSFSLLPEETVEVFGRGGIRVKPAVVVEYGLYSKLLDGTLSLVPQGGVVVQLGHNWQASTLASHRIDHAEALEVRDFNPVFHGEAGPCEMGERYCYQVMLSRLWGEGEDFSVGATHRQFGETLRLYFNEDFFSRLESLYMVQGDRVPELQLGLTRRLSDNVLTRLESNVAAGGGGIVTTGDQTPYENQVRYLVTSLDTQFESTSTGLFLAFHRLQQELEPVDELAAAYPEVDLERLQLSLTQDLGFLTGLAWDWAVHVNMELSRGATPDAAPEDEEELRKRLTTGIAVTF